MNTYSFCREYIINKTEKERLQNIPRQGIHKYKENWINRKPVIYDL